MDVAESVSQIANVQAECIVPSTAIPYPELVRKAMGRTAEERNEDGGVEWLEPPLNLLGLKNMVDTSTILPQCCTAYGDNIAGFGMSLAYIDDVAGEDETPEMQEEWDRAKSVIDSLSTECDVADVFVEALKERERCGIAYIECVRNLEGNVVEVINLLDTDTIRKSKADAVATTYVHYLNGEATERQKKFRRYRQQLNGKTVYFKEFGDPRTMDLRTGEYTDDSLDIEFQANELLELKIGNDHYGKVRWIGQILCIDGSHAAEVLNCSYFHNGRHTPMMILITGGRLTEKSRSEIQQYLSSVKGEKGQHGFLLMEVAPKKGKTALEEDEKPNVEIKDLGPMLQNDALFGKYLDDNRKKVQSAFRLPDIYVAYTTSYNKATVYAAMQLTEQQVFDAERKSLEWKVNNQLLNTYGFKHVKVVFNAPIMADDDALHRSISLYAQYGGLTPNKAKEKLYEALGDGPAENYDGDWGDVPLAVRSALPSETEEKEEPELQDENGTASNEEKPDNGQTEQELADQVDSQVQKARADGAADETLYVLRQTRNLLRDLARQKRGDEL